MVSWFMVFNATFNNISVISWQSVLLVAETGVPGENHRKSDMSFHSDTLFWFRTNQSLLFLLSAACLAEKQQIPIL